MNPNYSTVLPYGRSQFRALRSNYTNYATAYNTQRSTVQPRPPYPFMVPTKPRYTVGSTKQDAPRKISLVTIDPSNDLFRHFPEWMTRDEKTDSTH